jgi:hypothetical protein
MGYRVTPGLVIHRAKSLVRSWLRRYLWCWLACTAALYLLGPAGGPPFHAPVFSRA